MNEENKNLIEEVKKYFDEKTEESKRYFSVAVEEFKSEIKVFGEQLSDVKTKVDSLETKVDSLVEDMDYVKTEIVEIKDWFKEVDHDLARKADGNTVDDHERRISGLEKAVLAKA